MTDWKLGSLWANLNSVCLSFGQLGVSEESEPTFRNPEIPYTAPTLAFLWKSRTAGFFLHGHVLQPSLSTGPWRPLFMHLAWFSHLDISLVVVAYNFVPHANEPLSLSLLRVFHIIFYRFLSTLRSICQHRTAWIKFSRISDGLTSNLECKTFLEDQKPLLSFPPSITDTIH